MNIYDAGFMECEKSLRFLMFNNLLSVWIWGLVCHSFLLSLTEEHNILFIWNEFICLCCVKLVLSTLCCVALLCKCWPHILRMISFSWSVFVVISVLPSHYLVLSPLWDDKRFQITNFLSSHLCQFKFIKCWGQDTSHHSLMFDQSVRAAINNKTCRWFLKVKIP